MEKHSKTLVAALSLALVVVGLAVGAAGGAVAADVEIANDTVSVDNQTQSVYAEIEGAPNSSTDLTVEFTGLDDSGNQSFQEQRNVTVGAGNTSLVERTELNASAVSEVRVSVTAPNLNSTNTTAEVGKIQKVAGGGGGLGGTVESAGGPVVVVAAAAAVLLFLRGRD